MQNRSPLFPHKSRVTGLKQGKKGGNLAGLSLHMHTSGEDRNGNSVPDRCFEYLRCENVFILY